MSRTMYDSTTAGDCPDDGDLYAGYIDGHYNDYGAMVEAFPGKEHVRISVNAFGPDADVLDVDNGDATPEQAPGWVSRQHAAGVAVPTVYCNRGNEGAIDQALHDAGIATDRVAFWLATLDGEEVTGTTAHGYAIVACQIEGQAMTGKHYDRSVVYDDGWPGHFASPPAPAPSGSPDTEDEDMQARQVQRGLNDALRYIGGGAPAQQRDLDWDDAHALALGQGGEEFLVEGLVAGTDPAEDQQVVRGLHVLHELAAGRIPEELAPAIRALTQQSGG